MVEDLGMSGIQYNIALSLFFIPYILLEGKPRFCIIDIEFEDIADVVILPQFHATSSSRGSSGLQHTSVFWSSHGAS